MLQRLPDYYRARGIDRRLRIAIVLPLRGDPQGLSRFTRTSTHLATLGYNAAHRSTGLGMFQVGHCYALPPAPPPELAPGTTCSIPRRRCACRESVPRAFR